MRRIILSVLFLQLLLPVAGSGKVTGNQARVDKAAELINNGKLDEALTLALGVVENLDTEEDLAIHVNVYNDLGVIYRRLNMNDSALYYYHKALDAAVNLKDNEWLATLSLNLSVFYHNLKHFNDAESYADMAVKYSMLQDDESLRFYAFQLASPIKSEVKKYDEALRYAREAWAMADGNSGNDDMRLRCIPSLATVFEALGNTDSLFHYINIGNRLVNASDNDMARVGFIQCRGEMCYRQQRWRDALRDMLALAATNGTLSASLYRKIADCYHHLGDWRRAYCYMDTARMWTDSLAVKDIESKLADFNVKYETKEKEMQLAEERSRHASLREKWLMTVLVAVLLIVVLVAVLLVLQHRHRLHLIFVRQCAELNEARQYIEGLETERSRMARELHDSVANGLFGVYLKMQGADSASDVRSVLADVERLRSEVRTLSHGLMPPEFTKHSLDEILCSYVSESGQKVQYGSSGSEYWQGLSKDVSFEVFRIAQECISNALAHSGADNIRVSLSVSEDTEEGILKVEDNGKRLDKGADGYGIGLRVMQERAKTIGGHLDIKYQGKGTTISLFFPCIA